MMKHPVTTEIYTLSLHDALPISRCEIVLRRAIWHSGLRFRCAAGNRLVGHPDIVLTRARIVIFCDGDFWHGRDRSEEHTSELQSRLHLVCRLLLEKKK